LNHTGDRLSVASHLAINLGGDSATGEAERRREKSKDGKTMQDTWATSTNPMHIASWWEMGFNRCRRR
jgi:hypothetical protein